MPHLSKYRVAILGASGYTGADLIRLLVNHENVEIVLLSAERKAGMMIEDVYPHLAGYNLPDMISLEDIEWPAVDLDVVFCALPHATSQAVIKGLLHAIKHSLLDEIIIEATEDLTNQVKGDLRIIDLSADFRLRDVDVYSEWYGVTHEAVDLQKRAVYGLPEFYRDDIKNAQLVACPGCYPTAALLALLPLLNAKKISPHDIIIDAKSGVSGAGRSVKETNLYVEVAEAMHPYGVGHHRHMPEIEQELSVASGQEVMISFTPHLIPMNRGELETIYVRMADGLKACDIRAEWAKVYADNPFAMVLDEGKIPSTRMVRGSNRFALQAVDDRISGRAILIVTIDNLVKGSSGQAIQNMNIMLGLDENTGLKQAPMFP